MAVISNNPWIFSVDPIWEGRGGTPFDYTGERTYIQKYQVHARTKTVTEMAIATAPGIPRPGSIYVAVETGSGDVKGIEYDALAILSKISVQQRDDDDWQIWIVTVEYGTKMPPGGPYDGIPNQGPQNDPTAEPPDVNWDFEVRNLALYTDAGDATHDQQPFQNSAGDPYTPAPTFPVAFPCVTISRNELGFNQNTATRYAYALNDAKFLGAPRGHVQCEPPRAQMKFRGKFRYWRVTYKLRFNRLLPDGTWVPWQPRLLDQGMREFNPKPGPHKKIDQVVPIILEGEGQVTHPILLDGKGHAIRDPDPVLKYKVPKFKDYILYNYESFTTLLVKGLA